MGPQAAPYKWVDEQGVTHYSQIPPPGRPASEVRVQGSRPEPPRSSEATNTPPENEGKASPGTLEIEIDESARVRQENCKRAREQLTALESSRRVRIKEDDDFRMLSEPERLQKIEEIKTRIRENCD